MKIVLDKDLKGRKLKKGKEYTVIMKHVINREGRGLGVGKNGFVEMKSYKTLGNLYLILNDDKYPARISLTNEGAQLLDREWVYNHVIKADFQIREIEPEIPPLFAEELKPDDRHRFIDLLEGRCWAVTRFSNQLLAKGIEVCDEFREIASSDLSKIAYVQGEMNALFLSVANYFSGCCDDMFYFKFDKHNKENVEILELANITYSHYWYESGDVDALVEVDDWYKDLYNKLYHLLTVNSDFGRHIEKHGLKAEDEGPCLKRSITRIINAIDAIFYDITVRVYQVPLGEFPSGHNIMGQYCLIFETEALYYRFYLCNID